MFLLAAILFLLAVGFLYQLAANRRDAAEYPAPGELVDSSQGRVHVNCQGRGSIPVILESGLGDCSLDWSGIQPELAQHTRVCAYDRPGLGWSSPSNGVLSSEEVAGNLHSALQNAGIPGPYILAGHSIGGVHIRAFAYKYPEDTAGLVLIDSAHENQRFCLPSTALKENRMIKTLATIFRVLAPIGLPRALRLIDRMQGDNFPEDIRPAAVARMNQTHFFKALSDEVTAVELNTSQTDPPARLGNLPLTVLSRGEANPGLPEAEFIELKNRWEELQQELVELSSNSRHIIAKKSGHYIHHDQPEVVIAAVRQLLEDALNR